MFPTYSIYFPLQNLDGEVNTAKIDCEEERIFCAEQGITGYPTLRLYLSADKFSRISSQDAVEIAESVRKIIKYNKRIEHDEF